MDLRTLPLLQNIAQTAARIIFLASILNKQSGVKSGSPSEQYAVNCRSIDRFMSEAAIEDMKDAKMCALIKKNIQLDPSEITACINDRILSDDASAKNLAASVCGRRSRKKRSFALDFTLQNYRSKKWPIPIPYNISLSSSSSTAQVTPLILRVIEYVAIETCVRFSQTTADQTLSFQDGQGCLSYQGRSENPLTVVVLMASCYSFGEILSLVATSLGLADDATRPDSGAYVYVNTSNIAPSNTIFILPIPPYSYYGFPYDYASVVHSNPLRLSRNGQMTFRTLDPLYQNTIGQRVQLSFLDMKLINTIYCSGSCAGITNDCQQGGYPDPNNCNLCKCPDGWSDRCQVVTQHDSGQCGQQFYDLSVTKSGTIKSPGYDSQGYYDRSAQQQCTWLLTAPPDSHVTITFLPVFEIFQVNLACYHWIEVRFNGSLNKTGPRFCGGAPLAQTIKSTGNQMMLLFRSFTEADRSYTGFKIQFQVDPCTVLWSGPMTNTLTYGGTEAQGPLSKEGCMAACEMNVTCNAVDLDYSSIDSTKYPRCFLLNIASVSPLNNQAQGVVEYRIIDRCYTSATTTTTTTTTVASLPTIASTAPTTTLPPTTTTALSTTTTAPVATSTTTTSTTSQTTGPSQACFTKLDMTQSPGGTYVGQGMTVADCLGHCLSVGCAGVDYVTFGDPSLNECWEHQSPNTLLYKARNQVINQYINNCNTSSATTSASTSTISTPTSTSTSTSTSTTTPTTTTTTPTSTTTTAVGATFNFGPTVCPTTTDRLAGVQSSGATKNDSIGTEADCANFCLATIGCSGVDVVTTTSPQECWIYSDTSKLINKFSNKDVVQYTFTRNCQSDTPIQPPTTPPSGACQNSWLIYNNSHSVGASKTTQPMLLPDCLGRCAADTNCVAVDFNSATNPVECWVHTNQANLNQRYAQPSITQYVLNVRCPTSPAPNPGCGGANGNPGVLYPPCSRPTNPPTTCVNKVITFVFQSGCWTQRVDYVSVACLILSCSGNARMASVEGGQQCVVPGWGPWSSCSASCGSFGFQVRYNYDICGSNNQYITVGQEQRICNAQVCPCSISWGCSRCCSGFYESSGYCYRM